MRLEIDRNGPYTVKTLRPHAVAHVTAQGVSFYAHENALPLEDAMR